MGLQAHTEGEMAEENEFLRKLRSVGSGISDCCGSYGLQQSRETAD